jgi:hypothetical protein
MEGHDKPMLVHNKAGGCCFLQGTEMTMADGSKVNVEHVELLDILLGAGGRNNKVIEVHRKIVGQRKVVSINGSEYFCTEDHPFKTQDGWKAVNSVMCLELYPYLDIVDADLVIGDTIEIQNGSVAVETIGTKEVPPETHLWNFMMDGNHTYVAKGFVMHNKCFRAGTKVVMGDGSWKSIEDVEIRDTLVGKDGMVNEVIELHRPTLGIMDDITPHKIRMVSINNGGYDTSEDHMFYTTEGWKTPDAASCKIIHKKVLESEGINDIQDLEVGDSLVTPSGTVKVESIEFKEDDPHLQLYNFMLTGNRTYHVIMEGHDTPVLVHNKACFVPGTEITMEDDSKKRIEDVVVGDVVRGDGGDNTVEELFHPTTEGRKLISINGGTYFCTEDHPFMAADGSWKVANVELGKEKNPQLNVSQLKVGDTMRGDITVVTIDEKEVPDDTPLHNFALDGDNTYVADDWTVHNKGCFVQGTEMTMVDHSKKKVEDIVVGDVLHGQGDKMNTVQEVYHPTTKGRKLVSINGGDYFCTEDHPFMTADGGWKVVNVELSEGKYPQLNVSQLGVGDTIEDHYKDPESLAEPSEIIEGGIVVETIDTKEVPDDTPLWNFGLDGDHTYIADDHLMHNKGCFIAGTDMTMANGTKVKVEDVELLDGLLGTEGKTNSVMEIQNKLVGNRKIVSVNGSEFFCTEDHPFKTLDGWKAVNSAMCITNYPYLDIVDTDLVIGDTIETEDSNVVVETIDTKEVSSETPIWNFSLDGDHIYIAEGLVLHNKCWVARKVYGEDNPNWVVFRSWLFENDGPAWLRKVYEMYGERFADWIDNKPLIQKVVRKWMDKKINKTILKLIGEV